MLNKIKNYLQNEKIFLTAALALAAILRFLFIGHRSIWHDEGFTALMIQFSPLEIIQKTMRDVHPPFYYLVLHYWAQIFGNSELALRGMSALLGVGIVIFIYFIIKKLISVRAARWAVIFTALGPFLIRYSQEARMWNLVAFLITAATYFLIKALAEKKYKWWVLYSISLILAAYTQYFSLLVLPAHWLYILLRLIPEKLPSSAASAVDSAWSPREARSESTRTSERAAGRAKRAKEMVVFLISNIFIIGAFSFWIPILLEQTSRVSSGYWIRPEWMTIRTVPSNLYRFLSYINFDHFFNYSVSNYIHELILVFLGAMAIYAFTRYKGKLGEIVFILIYFLFPMYFIFFYSLILTPIYQDRYFVWASIAFYSFLALFTYSVQNNFLKKIFASIFITLLVFGIFRVYTTESHGMREIGQKVTQNYQVGDEIISGELYAWFDFSYYNNTGHQAKIFADPEWIKQGYGEASLIYDQAENIAVKDLNELKPATDRIWFIGRESWRDYYKKTPANWRELDRFQKDDSQVILYEVQ